MHFNKFMGQELQVANRSLGLPLAGQNQTFIDVSVTQPITPLFQIYQLYKIAQADETIARAKAGMPPTQVAANVEKNFYGLLVAQKLLTVAEAKAKLSESKWLLANNSSVPVGSIGGDETLMEATKELATATSKVQERYSHIRMEVKRHAVDNLSGADFEPGVAQNWAQFFVSDKSGEANLLKRSGEPGRTRTSNPLIKSQLLYH